MKNSILIIITILLIFSSPASLISTDWTLGHSINMESAHSLYDERGISKGLKNNSEENLYISKANGNVIYQYPISHYTSNGTQVNVKLNYCGSVVFNSLSYYVDDPEKGYWKKITQNRPAWILGVNGFAVQVLGGAFMYTCNPLLLHEGEFGLLETLETLDNRHINWVIEGYDYCNTLHFLDADYENQPQPDRIKILKDDGSVLELINTKSVVFGQSSNFFHDSTYFTGTYIENSPNSKGFAKVSFDYNDVPTGDIPEHHDYLNLLDGIHGNFSMFGRKCPEKPRTLRYFPGDGLEYVFKESIIPYSKWMLDDNLNQPGGSYELFGDGNKTFGWNNTGDTINIGRALTSGMPTIFYLWEIRNVNNIVTNFDYSRHVPFSPELDKTVQKSWNNSKGRAPLISFYDHVLFYNKNDITIQIGHYNTTRQVVCELDFRNNRVRSGSNDYTQSYEKSKDNFYPYSVLGDVNLNTSTLSGGGYCHDLKNKINYSSWLDYISEIRELYAENSSQSFTNTAYTTRFEYEDYQNIYEMDGSTFWFPMEKPDNKDNAEIKIYNKRLKSITEPTHKYDLSYRCFDPGIVNEELQCTTKVLSLGASSGNGNYELFHNIIDEVNKYKIYKELNENDPDFESCPMLLYTEEYDYGFAIPVPLTPFISHLSCIKYDWIAHPIYNQAYSTETHYIYEKKNLSCNLTTPFTQLNPQYSYLKAIYEVNNNDRTVKTILKSGSPVNGIQLRWVDNEIKEFYKKLAQNETFDLGNPGLLKTFKTFTYTVDASNFVRDYGNTEINDALGKEISSITTNIMNPKPNIVPPQVLITTTDTYKNFPFLNTGLTKTLTSLDLNETYKNYINSIENEDEDIIGQDFNDDLIYAPYFELKREYTALTTFWDLPLLIGVLDKSETIDNTSNNRIGNRNVLFEDLGNDCEYAYRRGKVYQDFILGNNNLEKKSNEFQYWSPQYNLDLFGGFLKEVQSFSNNLSYSKKLFYYYANEGSQYYPLGEISKRGYENVTGSHSPKALTKTETKNVNLFGVICDHTSKVFIPQLSTEIIRKYKTPCDYETEFLSTITSSNAYNPQFVVDPNGWLTKYNYDGLDRLRYICQPGDFLDMDYDYGCSETIETDEVQVSSSGKSSSVKKANCMRQYEWQRSGSNNEIVTFRFVDDINVFADELLFDKIYVANIEEDYSSYLDCSGDPGCMCNSYVRSPGNSQTLIWEKCGEPVEVWKKEVAETNLFFYKKDENSNQIIDLNDAWLNIDIMEPDMALVYPVLTFRVTFDNNSFVKTLILTSIPISSTESSPDYNTFKISLTGYVGVLKDFLNGDNCIKVNITMENIGSNQIVTIGDCKLFLEGKFTQTFERGFNHPPTVRFEYSYDKSADYPYEKYPFHTVIKSKMDDVNQTSDTYLVDDCFNAREIKSTHFFGRDYLLMKSIIPKDDDSYYQITKSEYDGLGNKVKSYDQLNISTEFEYDQLGRVTKVKPTDYDIPAPGKATSFDYFFGLPDDFSSDGRINLYQQDFFGFVSVKTSVLPGFESQPNFKVKHTQYYDAFDRLRIEVIDSSRADQYPPSEPIITKYNYDMMGKLIEVIPPSQISLTNPNTIKYWYNDYGMVKYKYHPDLGCQSYSYDDFGNVRFSQSQKQAENLELSFFEYDELGRLLVVGEAKLQASTSVPIQTPGQIPPVYNPNLNLGRITDVLNPNILHTGEINNDLLTSNMTLLMGAQIPPILDYQRIYYANFLPYNYSLADRLLGFGGNCISSTIAHPVASYTEFNITPIPEFVQTKHKFENFQSYPQGLRITAYYDELPPRLGPVWSLLPGENILNSMAPQKLNENNNSEQKIRNLKGRLSVLAYRETGNQAFNYMIFSYDERGRVECLIRYTDNLGFDAVYYEYNSLNKIIKIRVIDPSRQFVVWYGYENNTGRLSKIWTTLEETEGLAFLSGIKKSNPSIPVDIDRPTNNSITYTYDKRNQIESVIWEDLTSPIKIAYEYNNKKLLKKIVAKYLDGTNETEIFKQELQYNLMQNGLIDQIMNTRNDVNRQCYQHFDYDIRKQRLTKEIDQDIIGNPPPAQSYSEDYTYNKDGKRVSESRFYEPTKTFNLLYNDPVATNRLTNYNILDNGSFIEKQELTYNNDGTLSTRTIGRKNNYNLWDHKKESFGYDMMGLLKKYSYTKQLGFGPQCFMSAPESTRTEWQYWYNPMKEREQKRLYYSPTGDANGSVYAWEYYLLGGMNEQLAVYQGVQMKDNSFRAWNSCTTYSTQNKPEQNQESFVYLYPVEYNIYGLGSSPLLSYRRMGMTGQWKKHLNIPDYIGNVRMVLREGVTPDTWTILDSYNYTAYGKSIFEGVSLAPTELTKRKFIGKQTDEESLLADHGVRKYDKVLGRFTCPDPLWEKYYSWTPYQYAGCNPVGLKDDNGKFSVNVHAQAENEALGTNYYVAYIDNLVKDAVGVVAPWNDHFDNLNSYSEVMDAVKENGGFKDMDKHTLGDFFSHSNYVDIWNNLAADGKVSGEIPLPTDVDPNSNFGQALQAGLKTTTYPDDGKDNKGHNTGYEAKDKGDPKAFGAKDNKSFNPPGGQNLYQQAFDLFVRALKAFN